MYTIRLIWNKVPHWIAWLLILLDVTVWELPQNLIGAVIKLFYCTSGSREVETYKQGVCQIQNWGLSSGISLGMWQFTSRWASKDTASHEIGHSVQSLYLGPLYIFTVGLCSIIWAGFLWPRKGGSYYCYWTESWANKLSGAYGG